MHKLFEIRIFKFLEKNELYYSKKNYQCIVVSRYLDTHLILLRNEGSPMLVG